MAWISVDEDKTEVLSLNIPHFNEEEGAWISDTHVVELRKGAIETLIGKQMSSKDDPIEI